MRLTTIFALCVLCTVALSNVGAFQTVTVLSPQTLVAQFPSGIDTRPALFGVPNYASSITGPVIYATPDDRDACQPLDSLNSMDTKIVMVDRGECTFVQKVKHAQDAGANAVIVVDNVEETNMPFMADDGSGVSVSIPSILVHKSDGQKIKDSLANGDTPMLTMSWGKQGCYVTHAERAGV